MSQTSPEIIAQPRLETARLILEAYQDADVPDIFAYASDPQVTRFLTWDAHRTLDDSKTFLEWIRKSTCLEKGRLFFVFAMRLKATGRVIGSIDFKNAHAFCGQIDYAMGSAHWGQGLMSEAYMALRDWSFASFPEMVRLQSYCEPENIGSRRVMEKSGLQYEGLRRKSFVVKGRPVDLVHYALIR